MAPGKLNSPLGLALVALETPRRGVDKAADDADDQPRLEQALDETVEASEEKLAVLNIAAEADQADGDDSGRAQAERRAWAPPPSGR